MTGHTNEEGVSVIVGTLLLILITVTAAAGLAVMVSQMQKDEMNRQSHLSAVKNEQILITGVTFESSPDDWKNYFLQPNGTPNQSHSSYSSVTFSLTNLNIDASSVIGISLNDKYPHNFTIIDDSPQPLFTPYNFSSRDPSPYLVVPASTSKKIRVNFTTDFFSPPQNIGPDDQVTIRVMTSLYNTFEKSFQPPNPVIQPSTVTQNLGSVQREILVLDGSQSFALNNNTIVDWTWSVQDALHTNPVGNCLDAENLTTLPPPKGKTVRLQPPSSGPFCVNLTVQDNIGMKKSSDYVVIPENDLFVPPTKPQIKFNPPFINVTILDINGLPLQHQIVNYILDYNPSNNLTLSSYVGETDVNGMTSSMVLGNGHPGGGGTGTVNVAYGNFQPFPVMVSNTSS